MEDHMDVERQVQEGFGRDLRDRPLFGGAMAIDLPKAYVDVSTLRQLPDTQECWTDVENDQSAVIEILAHDDSVEDHASAAFYFNDIADCNDAAGSHSCIDLESVQDVSDDVKQLLDGAPEANTSSPLPPPSCWILSGVQRVAKFKESERNELAVHLAVVRIPSVDSDIVVHMNQPININAKSSSTTVAHATAVGTKEEGMALFKVILRSLKVKDWGLFDGNIDEDEDENETPNMAPA